MTKPNTTRNLFCEDLDNATGDLFANVTPDGEVIVTVTGEFAGYYNHERPPCFMVPLREFKPAATVPARVAVEWHGPADEFRHGSTYRLSCVNRDGSWVAIGRA